MRRFALQSAYIASVFTAITVAVFAAILPLAAFCLFAALRQWSQCLDVLLVAVGCHVLAVAVISTCETVMVWAEQQLGASSSGAASDAWDGGR